MPSSSHRKARPGAVKPVNSWGSGTFTTTDDGQINYSTEIGDVLGVTESRVCQIHAKTVISLRNRLAEPTIL